MHGTPRSSKPQVAASVDGLRLFDEAHSAFDGLFVLERLVAADHLRALFVIQHPILRRRSALRVHLRPGTTERTWFERETVLLAQVDHPGIRPVYGAGYRGTWAYRVTKWIDGESLEEALARGPRPVPTVLRIARDLLSALEYAHGEGIVVRRVVPSSLMLTETGAAIVTDLRWANALLDVASPDIDPASDAFLAPEARNGRTGAPSSDVYTAAALLYVAVTGVAPAINPVEIRPPTALRRACPAALERVIMHALQLDPGQRYLTADEMGTDLLSDIGEFELRPDAGPSAMLAAASDPASWEKLLRRALGDDYELLAELGSGGFGRVYQVRDLALEREVALKVLHPWLTTDPIVVERFRREAQLAANMRHANIVDVFDIGGRGGLLWYIMAYVAGENLAQLVERTGPVTVDHAVRILEQSLAALGHAHAGGLIHRDMKPENILVVLPEWSIQLTDFGLALAVEGPGSEARYASRSGTPEYAAPEQLLGEPVDARADLYSLSLVISYVLTGEPPFGGGSIESILARKTRGDLPEIGDARDDVPAALIDVLRNGAARDPANRFPSAHAYADALAGALRPRGRGPFGWLRRGRTP